MAPSDHFGRQERRTMNCVVFFCCIAYLLLAEGSVSNSGDQIVQCAETEVKGEGHCGRPDANLCQAVEKYALALTCSLCDDQDKVQWSFSHSAKTVPTWLSQQTKTLLLAAVNVTNKNTSGCYMCRCGGEGKSMYFTVQVELPVPPTFLVRTEEDGGPYHFDLFPPILNVPLGETSAGVVCINCSAIGYPDLHYWWYYDDSSGDIYNASSDPCLSFYEDQPEILCFTPTVRNVEQQRTYYCQVSNIVQTVTAQQYITYPGSAEMSEWFVRPHQLQSRGEVHLNDGIATAICAAYPQIDLYVQLEYYVCAVPKLAEAGESACLFDNLTCCSCRNDSCHLKLGINVTTDVFYDSLGIPSDGCRVDSSVEGNFVCVVDKYVSDNGLASAKQFIGNFSFVPPWTSLSAPILNYSSVQPSVIHLSSPKPWEYWAVPVFIGVAVGIVVVVLCAFCCAVIFGCRRRAKRRAMEAGRPVQLINEENEEQAERRPLLAAGINASQPMMTYDSIDTHCQSMTAIACCGGRAEVIVSKWTLRHDMVLELPTPVPGATYFVEMCSSDGNRVRMPVGVAASAPDVVPPSPRSVPLGESGPNASLPSVEQIGGSSTSKPNHVRKLPFRSTPESPSPHKSPPHAAPAADSGHSSSPLTSVSSPATPNPKVFLTEGRDPAARATEISLSADATKKAIPTLPVKPDTTYRLDVPPCTKTVTVKFKTFGERNWEKPLPDDIDVVFPVTIRHLVKFVQPLAHYWDLIGHSLSVNTVKQLVGSPGDGASKMTRVFETWVDRGAKWKDLLNVLDELQLVATATNIRVFLHSECAKIASEVYPNPDHEE